MRILSLGRGRVFWILHLHPMRPQFGPVWRILLLETNLSRPRKQACRKGAERLCRSRLTLGVAVSNPCPHDLLPRQSQSDLRMVLFATAFDPTIL